MRQIRKLRLGIGLGEVVGGPFVGKEDDGFLVAVEGNLGASGKLEGVQFRFGSGWREPADDGPGRGFEARDRAVLAFQTILHDFKLQRSDGGEQGNFHGGIAEVQNLNDAFLQELFEALTELFKLGRVRVVQIGEAFRREPGNLAVHDGGIRSERVADAEFRMADEANDVAGAGFVDSFALIGKKLVRTGEPDFLAGAGMDDGHIALESAGADAHEGDAVAMPRIHVRLDFENETGKSGIFGRNGAVANAVRPGRGGMLEETIEHQLDTEVVHGAAEKDRRGFAREHGGGVKRIAGVLEHVQFLSDFLEGGVIKPFTDDRIRKIADGNGRAILAADGPFEQVHLMLMPVEDAFEIRAVADGPNNGKGFEIQDALEFIEQGERFPRGAVALVHERKDGDAALTTDFKELAGLSFDTFTGIDDHDHGIDGGEHAISVLGKILVTGSIEEIDAVAVVIKLQDGGTDGDAALAFELHPVGRGGALIFARGDRAGELHRATIEQELFGERRFAGVGMRDDGKRAAPGDFTFYVHKGGDFSRRLGADKRESARDFARPGWKQK